MVKEPKSLQDAIIYFSNQDNCIEYLASRRWTDGAICPICGSDKVSAFNAKRRTWKCGSHHQRREFSVKVGTIFEDSPIGLDKWLTAIWLVVNCKNGISSYELARDLKITQKSAWFLLHRIRLAMANGSLEKIGGNGGGPIEIDETFIGPNPQKMHRDRREARYKAICARPNQPVMGMLDRELRQVRAKVVPNVRRDTLQNEILTQIEKGSTVYTDSAPAYDLLKAQDYIHEQVNHVKEYVRGEVHTQGIENFWSLLKRGLKGTYVAVEPFHLDRYVGEQVFRFNNRATKDNPLTDSDRFALAVSQITGKRLTFAELTGKAPN
ncbi:MAG TPA: IS1595 family transposase [Terracidiphilus sp.]|nr:IS1595 family transposase [Terracidiphilus sp.]